MVRKKRKGVVKEAEASGASGSARPRVELERALREPPADAALPFALSASELPAPSDSNIEKGEAGEKGGEAAAVTTLRQWYARLCGARSLFDQLKMLQLFRSKCSAALAAQGDHEAFAAAAWRMAFRLYVAPRWQPVRKNFFLILKALADANDKLGDALENAASDELQQFLRQLLGQAQHAQLSPDEIVDVFDAMLLVTDFQFLAAVLVELPEQEDGAPGLPEFLRFCSQRLDDLAQPVTRYRLNVDAELQGDGDAEDASTSVVLIASERCGHALKNVILLATMKEALYKRVLASPTIVDDFFTIAESCAKILQTSVVHKDLLTQAALAYCLVLRLLLQCAQQPVENKKVVQQLLRAIYPEQHTAVLGTSKLDAHLNTAAAGFGDLSRLAMFRGVLSSLSNGELATSVDAEDNSTVMNTLFRSAQLYCQHESLNVRLYAFQVLEAFLRRAVLIGQGPSTDLDGTVATTKIVAFDTLTNLTTGVILNWGHNSKKVNQFMPPMFTHIVNYIALTGDFDIWKQSIITKLIGLPAHSRAKYGALSILAVKYGVKNMLAEYPSLMKSVLISVGNKDVSAAAAGLFSQFLDAEAAGAANPWLTDVVETLISNDANLRERVATYVMPLLLKKSPSVVVQLIDRLRATLENEQAPSDREIALWAIIEVVKYARKRIAPEKLAGVSIQEVDIGLRHQRAETRSAAFEAICASLKSTNAPTPEELALIKAFLVMSSKEISSGSRMNTMIGLKNVFFRVKESQRLARKASKQIDSAEAITNGAAFLEWVQQFVVTSLYAGSSPQRTTLGLEVMLLYLQVFGMADDDSGSPTRFLEPQVVTVLLNALVSSWDVIRSLAFAILELYPTHLPGYSSGEELSVLLKWSLMLCVSPRQRESDAGALFMRVIFKRSAAIQQFNIVLEDSAAAVDGGGVKSSEVSFVLKLTSLVLKRLHDSSMDKSGQGESPLVHGLLLSLRYIIESVDFDSIAKSDDKTLQNEWQNALHQVFRCVGNAMNASLSVVGDATSGVGDEELSANFAGVVGEVSSVSKSAASALKVDCRGHLIIENNGDDDEGGADSGQRAVVGSWLAARECGAIVDTLMKRVPLPRSNSSDSQTQFFTTEMGERGGEMLLNSLFELKHKGAVATAYQAFEGVCKSFLAHAERNTVLGSLPRVWADRLLDRLETSQQVFILRRSSGFAFSFVAILRAEPRNSAAVILPLVMSNLLRLAALDTDKIALTTKHEDHHLVWRSRVHALNILKLICQDAVLADDVSVYVSRMLEVAIFGFDCESWAVRNSSMMLFAATTQRAIGDKRIADGASSHKIPSADVFSRFPQLSEFLHSELVRFLSRVSSTGTRGTTPPGLFPVLMFLSRLKSSEDEDDSNIPAEGVPLSKIVPVVMKCAGQPTLAIRQMAAKVLAAIVRDSEVIDILENLIAELPNGISCRDPSAPPKSSTPKSSNYVHGVISQIHQVTRRYLGSSDASKSTSQNPTPLSPAQRAVAEVIAAKMLSEKMWLADSSVSPAIRGEYLELVDVFVSFCGSNAGLNFAAATSSTFQHRVAGSVEVIRSICVKELEERCMMPSQNSSYYRQHHTPGMYVVDRTLVSILFGTWQLESVRHSELHANQVDLALRLLASPVLQVRKRSIKKISNQLVGPGCISVSSSDALKLQTALATQLLVEVHPKIKARNLQLSVFFIENMKTRPSDDLVQKLLPKITDILESASDADVVAPALELLALLTSNSSLSSASWNQLHEQIVARSDEKQPLALRRAAAKAISHCDVLSGTTDSDTSNEGIVIAVDSWLSAIKLLQDDDANVRRIVNEAVSKAMNISAPTSDTLVLPQAIERLVGDFGKTQYGYSQVQQMVSRLTDAPTEIEQYLRGGASKDLGATDLSSRIFEAESDNYFAEPDLMAQNLLYQLELKRDQLYDKLAMDETILAIARAALSSLDSALHRGTSTAEWLGGVTHYPGVFPALQNSLIAAAAAASRSTDSPSESVTELRELSARILASESTLHPLTKQALRVVASGSKHSVAELLFLTPFWSALKA